MSEVLRTNVSIDREELNKILNALQEMNPKSERDSLKEFIAFAPHVRRRVTSVTTGSSNVNRTDTRKRETVLMKRKKPIPVFSYPLLHTTTGTIAFPASGHKLGGNGVFNGGYITVSNQARLNVTDEITIALWLKPKTASSDGLIVAKNNQYELKLQNNNQIAFRINSGSVWKTALTYTYTPNTWVNVVASYKSTGSGQKLYINGSLYVQDSETGSISTGTSDLKIGGDGTSNVPNGTAFSWLTILHKQVSDSWINDFDNNNLIDTSGDNIEITTIPFVGDENPRPDATTGLCRTI